MTYLMFDLAVGAVLLLFTLMGKKRGFVLTLFGLLAVFVAFLGGTFLSNLMAPQVGQLIRPVVEDYVYQILDQLSDPAFTTLPQAVSLLEGTGLYQLFGEGLKHALSEGVLTVTTTAAGAIAGYVAQELARVVLFLICFVVVLVAWKLLAHALDLAFRLPVLSSINAMMGAVLGLVKGAVLVFIAVWLLKDSTIPQAAQEQTYLLKFFCENSPLSLLAMI